MKTIANRLPPEACSPAVEWLGRRRSITRAWAECVRPDWMLWVATQIPSLHKQCVLSACDIAEDALERYWNRDDDRPSKAIEAARGLVHGEVSRDEAHGAYAAAIYSAATNAANAAYSAAAAADADNAALAANAAYSAAHAASAAYSAAHAAHAAFYAAESGAEDARNADIVRRYITAEDIELVLVAMEAS